MKRWIEIQSEGVSWLLDMAFLLSGYHCTFGQGCPGVQGSSDIGCCVIGTPIYKEEMATVKERVAMLTEDDWQNKTKRWRKFYPRRQIQSLYNTKIVKHKDGHQGCIFANRSDFQNGAGCAFHVAAVRRGEDPIDWKPEICWQVPLSVKWVEGIDAYMIRMTTREDWNPGYADYDLLEWWCTDDSSSWGNGLPVYLTLHKELKKLCDLEDPTVWPKIQAVCHDHWMQISGDSEQVAVPVTLVSKNPRDY